MHVKRRCHAIRRCVGHDKVLDSLAQSPVNNRRFGRAIKDPLLSSASASFSNDESDAFRLDQHIAMS